MKFKTLVILISLIFLFGCGFKVVDQNYFKEYKFVNTSITGEKRVAYLLRNKLKSINKEAPNSIQLKLDTKKTRQIKEKNIQNEITKYEITISAEVSFIIIEKNISGVFTVSRSGDYNVSDKYSGTLNNEKKLIKNIINDISDQILKNLKIKLDEL